MTRYPITIDQETVQIGTAAELSVALDVLQDQYDRQVLTQLRPHLAKIIPQARDFLAVMKSLAADDQLYLIEALGPHLAGILLEARYLRDLLATMAETRVEAALLSALGRTGLRSLILTAAEYWSGSMGNATPRPWNCSGWTTCGDYAAMPAT